MMRTIFTRSAYLAPLLATVTFLSGCAASFSVPDTSIDGQSDFGPVQGSVFGGHAPLVGAHVYVLQVGSGSIGAQATSLLGSGSTTSPGGYTLTANTTDPHIPVGWFYETTDSNGAFNLTNGYKCTGNQPVYLYAYGGAPSANTPPGGFNPSVVNLATLGICPGGGTFKGVISYVYMNEVSTVATAYAFQGFTSSTYDDATHIGYSGVNSALHGSTEGLKGIQNAANNTLQLYDIQGSVPGHIANYKTYNLATTMSNYGPGVVPQQTLNTLADILAGCVDSSNTTSPPSAGSNCAILFATATGDGTTTNLATGNIPTDTATAAINIARHPAGVGNTSYASTLFNDFTSTGAPFQPVLSVAPPDFTVGLQFASTANSIFTGPQSIATDSSGDFWFTTQVTAPNPPTTYGTGYLAEGSPLGTILHSNLNASFTEGNIAIDSSQNAWVGTMDGVIAPIYEDGPTTGYVFTSYGSIFTRPDGPVADNSTSSGNLYMVHGPTCPTPNVPGCMGAQNNPTLSEVTASGGVSGSCDLGPSSGTANCGNGTGDFAAGAYVSHAAIDAAGYIWMTSDSTSYGNTITRVGKATGAHPLGSSFPVYSGGLCGSGIIAPEQPAVDALGNAWIPVYGLSGGNADAVVINAAGTSCNFASTGNGPYGAAVDGVSNVWITNRTDSTLSGFNYLTYAPLTSTNLQPQNQGNNLLSDPMNIAIDISGDAFITNFGGNSIVEIIGLTTPVYGPLGVAAGAGVIGQTP